MGNLRREAFLPQPYEIRPFPSELTDSVRLLEEGKYHRSLALVERIRQFWKGSRFIENWTGWSLLIKAKNLFHLDDETAAIECLLLIPKSALNLSPDLCAQFLTTYGLMKRRGAYRAWKSANINLAIQEVGDAIDAFQLAQGVAFGEGGQLLRLNARLNEIYANGLLAAIYGLSVEENPTLILQAIKIEVEIRRWSPSATRDDLTGFAIIADLARGAHLTIEDINNLDESAYSQAAYLRLFGSSPKDWPTEILELSRTFNKKHVARARGLVLGTTLLTQPEYLNRASTLGYLYQINLQDVLISLQGEKQQETTLTRQVRQAISSIDSACDTKFRGRRVFR
jgi:hypothetical protein